MSNSGTEGNRKEINKVVLAILFSIGLVLLLNRTFPPKLATEVEQEKTVEIIEGEQPSKLFQKFSLKMESYDWGTDTAMCREHLAGYPLISDFEFKFFNRKPFLKVDYPATNIYRAARNKQINDLEDFAVFKSVENIWLFYYINSNHGNLFRGNGMIEEWQFATTKAAKSAYRKIKDRDLFIRYNSEPRFYNVGNRLYIFHTSGNLLNEAQLELFEQFKKFVRTNN